MELPAMPEEEQQRLFFHLPPEGLRL